jgi:hypothetical protein
VRPVFNAMMNFPSIKATTNVPFLKNIVAFSAKA